MWLSRRSCAALAVAAGTVALALASGPPATGAPASGGGNQPPSGGSGSVGVGQPAPEPPLQYTITCSDGQQFEGTLNGSGELQYPGVPAGTQCTASPVSSPAFNDVAAKQFAPVPPAGVSIVRYTEDVPAVVLSPPDGPPGRATSVVGVGFPPGSTATLRWSPGEGTPVLVQVDGTGSFNVPMVVLARDQVGLRQLLISGSGFPQISASYLVVPATVDAFGSSEEVAFRY